MYNITGGIPSKYCEIIMIIIQEIKGCIVYCRYQSKTANAGGVVVYSSERIAAHLTIMLQKYLILGSAKESQQHL
jgi:hypothetical protein